MERLKDGVAPVEIVHEDELERRLERSRRTGTPLRIKQGFDATAPDLHIGHAVSLWKLKTFQDLGHTVIFLIGDFTAMIGDPSGRSKTRPTLSREVVEANARTYREQVSRILDPDRIEIQFNSRWHAKRDIFDLLDLCRRFTVRRMLERDDFWKRFTDEQPISMLEFLYPLLQAYDSVALQADVELGGTDQRFNLMLTRHIQRAYDREPEVLFFMPLLHGTDGREKMSKSLGNTVGITDPPEEMYGKVMSISDDLMREYYELASGLPSGKMKRIFPHGEQDLARDAAKVVRGVLDVAGDESLEAFQNLKGKLETESLYYLKHLLAWMIVRRYHSKAAADRSKDRFLSTFSNREWPAISDLVSSNDAYKYEDESVFLPKIMLAAGSASSGSDARRKLHQGGVYVDGERVGGDEREWEISLDKPHIVKVGKRRFFVVYRDEEQLKRV